MTGEGKLRDYKMSFNYNDAGARLDLVKNLVAMANAGGGKIIFGRDETATLGLDEETRKALDSARIDDLVRKFVAPTSIEISHQHEQLENGRYLVTLTVVGTRYPLVMAQDGNVPGAKSRKPPLFRKGDIWIRHSSKTERVCYEDLRLWIERAEQNERERILSRITHLVNLPEDAELQVVSPGQQHIDSPQRLLEYAAMRHEYDSSHLLTSSDLVHLFINRGTLDDISETQLRLLISSALRRPPTLYWWLIEADDNPQLILDEVRKCLDAADRDKSDAARSIIEMISIFADGDTLNEILGQLRGSRYKHFRNEANSWQGREAVLLQLYERISKAKHDGQLLTALTIDELERLGTNVAIEISKHSTGRPSSLSRKLGDVTRTIWSKKSHFATMRYAK